MDVLTKEITIRGSIEYPVDYGEIRLLERRDLEPMITHRFGLDDFLEAFDVSGPPCGGKGNDRVRLTRLDRTTLNARAPPPLAPAFPRPGDSSSRRGDDPNAYHRRRALTRRIDIEPSVLAEFERRFVETVGRPPTGASAIG